MAAKHRKNTQNMLMFAVFVIAAILVWALFNNQYTQATSQEITYDKFLDMLEADEVASVEDTGSTWKITPKEKDKDGVTLTYYTGKMANDTELLPLMREKNVEIQPYIQNDASDQHCAEYSVHCGTDDSSVGSVQRIYAPYGRRRRRHGRR